MFARSFALLGAALAFTGLASAAADAGFRKGCCRPTVCYQQVMTPPVYETVMEKVMVQPGRCTVVQTPPVYRSEPQRVVLQPERKVVHATPAVYGKVAETVMVRPGYVKMKHRRGPCGGTTCAVTVPPKFKTRCRKVVVQPASYRVEVQPAVMGVVNRQVMVSPGSSRRVCEPPVYKMVPRQVMVSPGRTQLVPVAPGCVR